MIPVIILSIVGAVIAAVVGTLWYSEATPMGKIHMKSLGFDKLSKEEREKKMKEAKPKMMKMYTAQMLLSLLTSFAVVVIMTISIEQGAPLWLGLVVVAINWLCFMVPIIGSGTLWSSGDCDSKLLWKKFFSDILSNLVIVLLIALLVSLFVHPVYEYSAIGSQMVN